MAPMTHILRLSEGGDYLERPQFRGPLAATPVRPDHL
jgi:hypothetical protein